MKSTCKSFICPNHIMIIMSYHFQVLFICWGPKMVLGPDPNPKAKGECTAVGVTKSLSSGVLGSGSNPRAQECVYYR